MKVIDMLHRIDDLMNTHDALEKRAKEDDVLDYDSDLMKLAASAIDDFIQELYRKDIKV